MHFLYYFLYYFLLHFLCAFFITPTVFTWLRKIPQKLTSRRYFRPVALFVEPLPALGGFETLGGVDDATKCRSLPPPPMSYVGAFLRPTGCPK